MVEKKELKVQKRLINKAIKDPEFAKHTFSLRVNLFEDNDVYQELFSSLKDYYRDNTIPATRDAFETYLEAKLDRLKKPEPERKPYSEALDEVYDIHDEGDKPVFDPIIQSYIKKRRVINAVKELVYTDVNERSVDDFEKKMLAINRDSSKEGLHEIVNFTDNDNKEKIADSIESIGKNIIPIPVVPFNEATGGGLAKGEMGAIAASSGMGKTMSMASLATGYITAGYNVLYVALEELQSRMLLRFYKSLLGQMASIIGLPEETIKGIVNHNQASEVIRSGAYYGFLKKFEEETGKKPGDLNFTRYSPNSITANGLRQVIETLTVTQGKPIDIILVDYPDLLEFDNTANEAAAGGRIYEEMRAIAQENNAVMWVASQFNRTSGYTEVKTAYEIEGSFRKLNSCEFFGSINTTPDEFDAGYSRIYVDKSRNGGTKGKLIPMKVDRVTQLVRGESAGEALEHSNILAEANNSRTVEDKGLSEYRSKDKGKSFASRVNHKLG